MDLEGDTAVIGSYDSDFTGSEDGAVYVFVRTGNAWSLQQVLTEAPSSEYGYDVAISGDTLVVGVRSDGEAYVYTRSAGVWTQQQQLLPSNTAGQGAFGEAVDIDGDTLVVGDPGDSQTSPPFLSSIGAVYVFVRSGTTWTEEQVLRASDVEASAVFGSSVSIDGDTVAAGAPLDGEATDPDPNAGAVYVFTRSGTLWTQQQKLLASDIAEDDQFGSSVDLDGDNLAVGAVFGDGTVVDNTGSAYVFTRSGTTWTEQQKLNGSGTTTSFGNDISLQGDSLAVASLEAEQVFIFERDGTVWSETQALSNPSSNLDGFFNVPGFGAAVALDGSTLLVAAVREGDSDFEPSTYVYAVPPPIQGQVSTGKTLTDLPGPAAQFETLPALSRASGDLAFIGQSGAGRQGIYSEVGGTISVIADASTAVPGGSGTFLTRFIDVDSDATKTAFTSDLGVYEFESNTLSAVADTDTVIPGFSPATFGAFGDVEVTNGDVVFLGGETSILGIFRDQSGTLSSVVDTTTSLPGLPTTPTDFFSLATDQGDIAFRVDSSGGPGVFRESGGTITLIADLSTAGSGLSTFTEFRGVSIRNGTVSFVGLQQPSIGSEFFAIFRGSGGALSLVVLRINLNELELIGELDNGEVAFVERTPSGDLVGINRASSPATDTVIVDPTIPLVDGSTLTDVIASDTDGNTIIFLGTDPADQVIGPYEVSVGSAVTIRPIEDIPSGNTVTNVGSPRLEGDVLVFAARTNSFDAIYRGPVDGELEEVLRTDLANAGGFEFSFPLEESPLTDVFPSVDVSNGRAVFVAYDSAFGEYGLYEEGFSSVFELIQGGEQLPDGVVFGSGGPPVISAQNVNGDLAVAFDNASSGIYAYDALAGGTVIRSNTNTADPEGTGNLGADFAQASLSGDAVAFVADDSLGAPSVYVARPFGDVTLVANDSTSPAGSTGTLGGFTADTSVAASEGAVAFVADSPTNAPTIYFWSGSDVRPLVEETDAIAGGGTIDDLTDADIDLEGVRVAFTAIDDSGSSGVFVSNGSGLIQRLATEGEAIKGSTSRTYASFSDVSLSGDRVAFVAVDNNGTAGVFVSQDDPDFVPVPLGREWLVILALLLLLPAARLRSRAS